MRVIIFSHKAMDETKLLCSIYRKFIACQFSCSKLNVCWNMVILKNFGYHKCESVKMVIDGLRRVDVIHLIQLHKIIAFYRQIFNNIENSVLCIFKWVKFIRRLYVSSVT